MCYESTVTVAGGVAQDVSDRPMSVFGVVLFEFGRRSGEVPPLDFFHARGGH